MLTFLDTGLVIGRKEGMECIHLCTEKSKEELESPTVPIIFYHTKFSTEELKEINFNN